MSAQSNIIPVSDAVIDDNGKAKLTWILFFQALVDGDNGTKFTPAFTGLNSTGTPTITGVYYQNQGFADFYVRIVPATDTTSTAGTTYFNLPFVVTSDCPCFATEGAQSTNGAVVASLNRCYPPTWAAQTQPITISGRCPIQ